MSAQHRLNVNDLAKVIKDLSKKSPEVVGLTAKVLELLPVAKKHAQYKVLIFGEKGIRGGVFEVDDRELGPKVS